MNNKIKKIKMNKKIVFNNRIFIYFKFIKIILINRS